jgi:hypothetical protein
MSSCEIVGGRLARGPKSTLAGRRSHVATTIVVLAALVLVPATQAGTKFVSKRYGYTLVLPGGSGRWLSSFATEDWSSGEIEHGSPEFDTFNDLQTGRIYFLAARPSGSSLRQWTASAVSGRPGICGPVRSLPQSMLGGAQARLLTWPCSDGYRVFAITAIHAHRGYIMLVASLMTLSPASDLHALSAARRSFRFSHT